MSENSTSNELLARLDERSKATQEAITALRIDFATQNQRLDMKINEDRSAILNKIDKLENDINENFVKKESFEPVKKIAYRTCYYCSDFCINCYYCNCCE